MDKIIGVTLPIYLLCRELERLENNLNIKFSVFYSFAETLESSHFGSGFEIDDGYYYEVQQNDDSELEIIRFYKNSIRYKLSNKEIIELTETLKKI